ncbi:hypothetical protein PPL_01534 [Heterostelium album PN500]|uniref:Uncharacterized protein n=1 Tax=Heterostelium pallidum (strain ATCC 26659 / Pp 5 / PN500) TaxID=670386 RepID=D3AZS1_HETP5|nr:hypothetical protein PPL_01534 [Heterostelium album PN500]EFA84545.1 hypothetical protein PPL_01534 [Heterostelium album PN500]|eukprot:XP_020436658.1 hypothetical protein PPL_01534 [Heterostelium album PN500]
MDSNAFGDGNRSRSTSSSSSLDSTTDSMPDDEIAYDMNDENAPFLQTNANQVSYGWKNKLSSKYFLFQLYSFCLAALYLIVAILLPFLNKKIFSTYNFPLTSSFLQTLGAAIILFIFNVIHHFHHKNDLLTKSSIFDKNILYKSITMIPVSICFAIVISLTNIALSMIPVNYHVIFKSTNITFYKVAEGTVVILVPMFIIEHIRGFTIIPSLSVSTVFLVLAGVVVTMVYQSSTVGLIKSLYVTTVGIITQVIIVPQIFLSIAIYHNFQFDAIHIIGTVLAILGCLIFTVYNWYAVNYKSNQIIVESNNDEPQSQIN